ncbi:MAG TPA: hypothetical protein VI814_03760 [Candidatus Limnocylindria bacterium]
MSRLLARTLVMVAANALATSQAVLAAGTPPPLPIQDPAAAAFTTIGGATPLATDATVPHWHGQFTDPTNGVTYGYNMVGNEDPRDPGAGTTVVPVDIIPLRLSFERNGGFALDGADEAALTVASPLFQTGDYTATSHSSGGAGPLSSGNVGVQYEDAIMRSQFDKTGTDYHLILGGPTVFPTVSLSVPSVDGAVFLNSRGVTYALADELWFSTQVQQLLGSLQIDPTHLPIFLTDNVFLVAGRSWFLGYHGAAKAVGRGPGSTSGNGSQGVNTFIYSAYIRPGTYQQIVEFLTDIHPLSHEVAEWAADPFINNTIDPAFVQTTFAYGCLNLLEVGDPVAAIGFTMPGNPDTRPRADGSWHPEDEAFLPWFARESPNVTSQLAQSGASRRYTFMGDLNPYAIFRAPAPHC